MSVEGPVAVLASSQGSHQSFGGGVSPFDAKRCGEPEEAVSQNSVHLNEAQELPKSQGTDSQGSQGSHHSAKAFGAQNVARTADADFPSANPSHGGPSGVGEGAEEDATEQQRAPPEGEEHVNCHEEVKAWLQENLPELSAPLTDDFAALPATDLQAICEAVSSDIKSVGQALETRLYAFGVLLVNSQARTFQDLLATAKQQHKGNDAAVLFVGFEAQYQAEAQVLIAALARLGTAAPKGATASATPNVSLMMLERSNAKSPATPKTVGVEEICETPPSQPNATPTRNLEGCLATESETATPAAAPSSSSPIPPGRKEQTDSLQEIQESNQQFQQILSEQSEEIVKVKATCEMTFRELKRSVEQTRSFQHEAKEAKKRSAKAAQLESQAEGEEKDALKLLKEAEEQLMAARTKRAKLSAQAQVAKLTEKEIHNNYEKSKGETAEITNRFKRIKAEYKAFGQGLSP